MAAAEVGDDVYGEDLTVNRLEALAAETLGTEAGLLYTRAARSGISAGRRRSVIVNAAMNTSLARMHRPYKFEGGARQYSAASSRSRSDSRRTGTLDLSRVAAAIKPDDCHFARTRLLCLENTQGGKVLPVDYLEAAADFANANELALHLDGARLFNAAVRLQVPASLIARHFDTVSVCLSEASRWARWSGLRAAPQLSPTPGAGARCWAGACARRASWRPAAYTR
ncbi:MAG: beta-eliminating lyase-related protein [Woeseiaceae bacterium]|nr:beta-eliminating lyase-related protein [Woeseiaceae bacterium]